MRLFELMLLISNALLLLPLIFPGKINRNILFTASVLSGLLLIIHLAVEGYRLQMILPYCITAAFLIVSVYKCFIQRTGRTISRFISVSASAFLALLLLLTIGLTAWFPFFKLPEPTGSYQVGTQTFHFTDKNRNEVFAGDKKGKRELMVQVWYPAQNTGGEKTYFIPEGKKMINEFANWLKIPGILIEYLKYIPAYSYKDAEVSASNSSYPILILNHGFSTSRVYYTSQAENLASHGYIVVSIDHTYSTLATVFPDGRTTYMNTDEDLIGESVEYRDKVGQVWTADIAFTLDQLEKINSGDIPSVFKGKLDLSNIGVFGHSFGGAASYDISYDSRIKAGIDLDGSLYRYHNKESITKPFMFIFSEQPFDHYKKAKQGYVYTNQELEAHGATREQSDKDIKNMKAQVRHLERVAKNGGQILYIEGTAHNNFLDQQFFSPLLQAIGLTGKIDPQRCSSIVSAYVLDFFDKYLRNQGGKLLTEPSYLYPEVKFGTSLFR